MLQSLDEPAFCWYFHTFCSTPDTKILLARRLFKVLTRKGNPIQLLGWEIIFLAYPHNGCKHNEGYDSPLYKAPVYRLPFEPSFRSFCKPVAAECHRRPFKSPALCAQPAAHIHWLEILHTEQITLLRDTLKMDFIYCIKGRLDAGGVLDVQDQLAFLKDMKGWQN